MPAPHACTITSQVVAEAAAASSSPSPAFTAPFANEGDAIARAQKRLFLGDVKEQVCECVSVCVLACVCVSAFKALFVCACAQALVSQQFEA